MTPVSRLIATFATAVFFLSSCATTSVGAADDVSVSGITFLHLNDTYRVGSVEDGNRGGFGRVTTIIRELQKENRECSLKFQKP